MITLSKSDILLPVKYIHPNRFFMIDHGYKVITVQVENTRISRKLSSKNIFSAAQSLDIHNQIIFNIKEMYANSF
jgi:hypothetical protein